MGRTAVTLRRGAARLFGGARRWVYGVRPRRADLRADALAGLPGAISTVPDGLASATLVGVNPAFGLYAAMAGPILGGLTASTRLMVVTTTSAASLAAGSALAGVPEPERDQALIMLTLLAGVLMTLAGIFRLGRYVRFVSRSVMLGFLTGIAVNIILGQFVNLVGATTTMSLNLTKALDVLLHPSSINVASALTGLTAILILVVVGRTRLAMVASLAAVVVPTLAVIALGADSVARVSDANTIPTGLPALVLPRLQDLTPTVILGALAVASIVLVQGAGVAESAPNADGAPADVNRNFIAQGAANMGSALVHGIPVGGSVSSTAMNKKAGARSRWGAIFCGLWLLVIVVALAGLVAQVASPTLAAVLIVVGFGALAPGEIVTVWRTHSTAKIAMTTTFVATLLLPVAAAVATGVIVSLLLQLNREALDLKVVQVSKDADGRVVERPAPAVLPDREPVVLDVYGSLLYAGAATLRARLPEVRGAVRPVVILRLRGRTTLGSTFFATVTSYGQQLAAAGGRLYLSGVDPELVERYQRSYAADDHGDIQVFEATEVVGDSTLRALDAARTWLVSRETHEAGPAE